MSRYIDARKLKGQILREYEPMEDIMREDAIDIINEQPSADVVEVVRCKDCKRFHYEISGHGLCYGIQGTVVKVPESGYCFIGERADKKLNNTDVTMSVNSVQSAMAAFGISSKDANDFLDTLDRYVSYSQLQIDNAPTADVVEVVHCRDCKYRDTKPEFNVIWSRYGCRWHDGERPEDDDYCSYGERTDK